MLKAGGYSKAEIYDMTLSEIKNAVRFISRERTEDRLTALILNAIAAQGDKKSIDKVSEDLRKTLREV